MNPIRQYFGLNEVVPPGGPRQAQCPVSFVVRRQEARSERTGSGRTGLGGEAYVKKRRLSRQWTGQFKSMGSARLLGQERKVRTPTASPPACSS